ncbi:MAG TPA: hypothetical protein VK769_05025, partial [Verrucomicrobiae bacterium]|nr:hypothetical protein [Verrucomicrobiae bacterium]
MRTKLYSALLAFSLICGFNGCASTPEKIASTNSVAAANDLTVGWTQMKFTYEVQHPYDLSLTNRYSYDAKTGTHDFWVYFTDKPHAPPPNRTTARTEMRLETFSKGEH